MKRSFGWVQDAGKIYNLRKIVEIFISGSPTNKLLCDIKIPAYISIANNRDIFLNELKKEPITIPYSHLKGKGVQKGGSRSNAPCTGIAQAVLESQNGRPYVSDWAIEAYLRLAVSCGLLKYDQNNDICSLSETGRKLANSQEGSQDEKTILGDALLSYPPACRVLQLLKENPNGLSKYAIGQNLGFIGEAGFTSFPERLILESLASSSKEDQKRIKQNSEGTSDKYARMIAGWLCDLGWASKTIASISFNIKPHVTHTEKLIVYKINLAGIQALNKSLGKSTHSKIAKIVRQEMLATSATDWKTLRRRRALILDLLSKKDCSLTDIENMLSFEDCQTDPSVIIDDLIGINHIGINIEQIKNKYILRDKIIGLEIPSKEETNPICDSDYDSLKNQLRTYLKKINHKYLLLIDYAFKPENNLLFELTTIELLKDELGLNAVHLGHSNKPDGVMSLCDLGVIIDNKSYSEGFSLPITCKREMKDYIQENEARDSRINSTEWWKNFSATTTHYSYLFISSFFKGKYQEQMNALSLETGISGAVISAQNLLKLAEGFKKGLISDSTFKDYLTSNKEITVSL